MRPSNVFPDAPRPPSPLPPAGPRTPSGLFPAGRRPPPRPVYREPHPVTPGAVAAGCSATVAWLLVTGLLGGGVVGYLWGTVIAGGLAWVVALALIRYGDRGVGAGVALATSLGWSIAAIVLAVRWISSGDWPLW